MSATAVLTNEAVASLAGRDLLSISDLTTAEAVGLFDLAGEMKRDIATWRGALAGRSVIMLFEKASLRTRVSFEVGVAQMGGHAMYFDHSAQKIGERESVKDYGRNLERWVQGIIARVYSHEVLAKLAANCDVPVVNALCDEEHPCQALADLFTLREKHSDLAGLKLAYVGDGNNVCHSLLLLAAKLGVSMTIVTPRGFEPQFEVLRRAQGDCVVSGASIRVCNDIKSLAGHHAVYTDVWVSMGQSHQSHERMAVFGAFQVDEDVMARASEGLDSPSLFMHCLPAKRGVEVTDGVIDSASSVVYDQAENRMHVQNALLASLLAR